MTLLSEWWGVRRLWGYGIGIHLIGGGQAVKRHPQLDPKSDHLSFIVRAWLDGSAGAEGGLGSSQEIQTRGTARPPCPSLPAG